LDLFIDVYIPQTANKQSPAPILIWWHGGGLLQGTRKAIVPHMVAAPANHNICVVSADYRLAPQTRFPGILSDCKAVIEYLHSPEFASATGGCVDPSKLVLSGSSAGGWLALLSGTGIGFEACGLEPPAPPINVAGIAAIYPITGLLDPFWTTKQQPLSYMDRTIDRSEVEPFIDPDDEKTAFSSLESKRNIFYHYMVQEGILANLLLGETGIPPEAFDVTKQLKSGRFRPPPIYLVHGDQDDKVPPSQARDVIAALEGPGVNVQYDELEGLNHLFDKEPHFRMEAMYGFIKSVLVT